MIPNNGEFTDELQHDFILDNQPSLTPRLNPDTYRIEGFIDGNESVMQTVYTILNIERYKWEIFTWSTGVELLELFGKQSRVIISELERRIKEALIQDDRIEDVVDFNSRFEGDIVVSDFNIVTIFGNLEHTFKLEVM